MKAPDKIYIPLYPNNSLDGFHLGDDWMYEPHKECDNAIYIHKNALMEWLEKRLHEVGLAGMIHIIDVINKLNSM